MSKESGYEEELTYLIEYARMSPVYFTPVRDAAEAVAGPEATEEQIQEMTVKLIGDMLNRGVRIGDMSPVPGEMVVPWELSHDEALRKVADKMQRIGDPLNFVHICWFDFPAGDPSTE
ncbi:hypothetical protein [Streptomyces mobaraensis]|uniref:hypothetical protein n=1 Tax=Streptomyces mobaraensis TaxID=35621 RepID=UPI0033EAF7D2